MTGINKYISAISVLLMLFSKTGYTQKNIIHQQLVWFAYTNSLEINPRFTIVTEIHERRYYQPDAQHQFALRGRVHYTLNNNWDIAVCFAYFLQSPNEPRSTSTLVIPELRPHVDLNYKQALKHLSLLHRYRIEDRFFRNTSKNELVSGYNSNWRFRYMFTAEIPLIKFKNEGGIKLKIGDEIFVNAGKNIVNNTFDHNRIFIALTYAPVKSIIIEAGYLNWFQQRSTGVDYYDRDILRFSISQKIKLYKPNTAPK